MKLFYKYFILGSIIVAGCDENDDQTAPDKGFDYFPVSTGLYAIYDVEEIHYSTASAPDTLVYQMMTVITDSFANGAGGITYVMHRSKRTTATDDWEPIDTWSVRMDLREVVVNESNVSYLKLVFPLEEGAMWDGNKFNTLASDEYEVKIYDAPLSVNGLEFDRTMTVEQEAYDDEVTRTDIRTEVYARNVGLIRKESTVLTYCTEQVCLNQGFIDSGIIYKQEIREYGIQ